MAPVGSRRTRSLRAAVSLTVLAASSSASLLSAPFDALRGRAFVPRSFSLNPKLAAADLVYLNASVSQPQVVAATTQGRYGHSALYLPTANELLLIGGQVGENGTAITDEILRFRLASTFLWGDRPESAIPDNPAADASLSSGLPASAWAAAALDGEERPWLIGGLTQDCEADAIAHTLLNSTSPSAWTVPALSPRYPPRRRQASAVSVPNATTGGTDLWVLGGIADEFTCSSETIGYAALDRYDTVSGTVESMAWTAPAGTDETGWQPPLSDYSATVLAHGASIAVVGGQSAEGHVADLFSVLVFDVVARTWSEKTLLGTVPPARMGHAAVPLSSGSILVHGGVSSAHAILADLFLLAPPSDASADWTSTQLVISDHSMIAPALAYHTATLVAGKTIVVAFGIDGSTSAPSNRFWFLAIDENAGTYTWKDTFEGNADAVALAPATASASTLDKRAIDVVLNPKVSSTLSTPVQQATPATDDGNWYGGSGGGWAQSAAPVSSSASVASVSKSSKAISSTPPMNTKASTQEDDEPTSTSTIIGASVGAIGGAVALAGMAFLLLRRRASQAGRSVPSTPVMGSTGDNDGQPPFVSQLLYTRPAQTRNMSLGSTLSALSPRAGGDLDSLPPSSPHVAVEGPNVAGIGAAAAVGLGASQDPFSDSYRVNEVGQLERAASGASSTGGVVGALKSSVQSIPFLSTVAEASPSPAAQQDVYTAPAPTLSAKRSLRRPAQPLPSLPVPGTPAELIGVAITSDDGHDGLPYLAGASESWDPAVAGKRPIVLLQQQDEIREVSPSRAAEQIPSALRPGTPLRVANPDPFSDQ
ncbi:hypothetical protein Rhopal_006847-T1 [Rhodotorula paludigena]|uniref:Galactose oxidase n=1 Tax=Rhodotorula paludigena TaxID=86838 RepID=A0AAV5GTE0_9BASI|nr:hypothetical protein Rhopal_006847-T1 [Rhodotorula paludigena]